MSKDNLQNKESQPRKRPSKRLLLSAGLTLAEVGWLVITGASVEDYAFLAAMVLIKIAVASMTE